MHIQVEVGLRTPHYINMPGCGGGERIFLSPYIKSSNCGKALKLFQPNKYGNMICGTSNDTWYGKIEIDARKEIGNPQPITNCYKNRALRSSRIDSV